PCPLAWSSHNSVEVQPNVPSRGRRAAPRGFEPRLPDPERRLQGNENRQIDREWRPDEHRRPVGLTSLPARARRNACKTLAESSGRLSLWVAQESVRSAKEGPAFSKGKLKCLYQAVRRLVIRGGA